MEQSADIIDDTNFLEISVVAEMLQTIEQIENTCKGQIGEDIVTERIKQVAYSKILCNVFQKDIKFLIKAYSSLGIAYFDINYYPQAEEHLLNAFKLNESISKEDGKEMKEQQIKILVNLAKCFLENKKEQQALKICEKSLQMNKQIHEDDDHVSNADIYYVIAKAHIKLGNYQIAIENLNEMYEIHEKLEGSNSDKTAKILMEIGQVYELWKLYDNAIESYNKSFQIWEQIITNDDYNILFQLSTTLADLYAKKKEQSKSYDILCKTDNEYGERTQRTTKDKFAYQKKRIKYSMYNENRKALFLEEYLRMETILTEADKNPNALAKTCISIAVIFLEDNDLDKCLEYFNKAAKIYKVNRNMKRYKEVQEKIEEVEILQKNQKSEENGGKENEDESKDDKDDEDDFDDENDDKEFNEVEEFYEKP